jgi:serine/threonine protein kinase
VAGTLVGRYELEVPLGRGAMGEVWRGRDLATRQPVAVKLVQLANIDNQVLVGETIARFRREADTLARLRHPNIISALEAGRVGSELFMVMELAEGMSMAAMLRQRQANGLGLFPVESVLRIAKQACSGLAAAHAIGVVHRDIKPSNLMVSARGHLTIVDFGIARLLEDNSPRLTAQDETVGTLLYMSPEQAAGIDVDGRSDLYSFGCVLYELLAGRPPFVAEIPITLMRMHLQERPVPIRNVRSDLPNGLPELVDRLLEKERGARPPDAEYVVRSLVAISDNFNGGAIPEHEADRRTFVVGGGDQFGGAEPRPPAAPGPEGYRATVLANDPRPWPRQEPSPEAYRPTALAGEARFPQDSYRPAPNPADQGLSPNQPPSPPPWQPPAPGSGRRGKSKRRANAGPDGWPTARPRPRRRRWTGVLSSLLTFAIVAGIAAYVWNKTHQTLKITAATVSVANPGKIACNSTVDVVGTIFTNGNGGPITYQWTKDGDNLPTGTVTATSGQQQVRVDLKWNLRGKGTHHAAAIFQVFTPNVVSAQSASFTYECAA